MINTVKLNDQYLRLVILLKYRNINDVTRRSCARTIEIVDTGEANVLIRFKILIAIEIVVVAP